MSEMQPCQSSVCSNQSRADAFSPPSEPFRSAGFKTCCIADFPIGGTSMGGPAAGFETRDTADLEVSATTLDLRVHQK
jgi:hypothetical protein